jgi:hypothetical protein
MSDTIAPIAPAPAVIAPQIKGDGAGTHESNVEPPFTDYQKQYKHPFIVDYFKLGDRWADELGGFSEEVKSIEGYFTDKINKGEMINDTEAVREKLKGIYKLCNIDKTERTTMQIEKLAAYIDFLRKTDDIKLNHQKYGR